MTSKIWLGFHFRQWPYKDLRSLYQVDTIFSKCAKKTCFAKFPHQKLKSGRLRNATKILQFPKLAKNDHLVRCRSPACLRACCCWASCSSKAPTWNQTINLTTVENAAESNSHTSCIIKYSSVCCSPFCASLQNVWQRPLPRSPAISASLSQSWMVTESRQVATPSISDSLSRSCWIAAPRRASRPSNYNH